ncbi:MAG: chemotaxis protein CheA [Cyanobacteria bacterium]|nr:chemotaxis protein CheA [Cyanobacteriota bacterium]
MSKTARKKSAKKPPVIVDDELATFAADPELASMFVADGLEHLGTIEQTILRLEKAPGDLSLVNDLFRPFHTVKGNAGVLGIRSVEAFAHKLETLLDLARSGSHPMGQAEIDVVLSAVDTLTIMVRELPARVAGEPHTDLAASCQNILATVDALIAGGSAAPIESVAVPAPQELEGSMAARIDEDSTIKVNTRKLDALVDMVGELVIAQTILADNPALQRPGDDRLSRQMAQIRRITSDIQRDAMSMRMVPIRRTFQKMARLVRDLSKKFDKPADVTLIGEDTELDRKLIEQLTDPLMHMVRNTVDHGIEPGAERLAAGKPETAQIQLRACHRAGGVVVEIADDGAGLDTERILARAVAQAMVPHGSQMSVAEIHQLIFRPGFSTADRVTEVSGRGVGMDVVRRNIQMLRGRIDIQTVRGRGATFTLHLPLTLAIVDGLVLGVGGDRFVIPTPAVRESLRPTAQQIHTTHGRPSVVQVRDRLIPLLHLGELFSIGNARTAITDGTVVIAEDNGREVALVVDEMLGKREVVIRSLGEMFRGVRGIAGGAILGDGRIGLILDTGGLLALASATQPQAAA